MAPDQDDDEALTETDVDVHLPTAAESTITAIKKPRDVVVSTLDTEMPADTEPSTLEPTAGVRSLATAGDALAPDDEEERTTLKVDSRVLRAAEWLHAPPPPSGQRPSTSTAPKRIVPSSPTPKVVGKVVSPMLTPSEPFRVSSPAFGPEVLATKAVLDERRALDSEATLDLRDKTKVERARAAPPTPRAAEPEEDSVTADDASLLSGGENIATVAATAAAATSVEDEDEDDDDKATSIRHEQSVILAEADLVTDPGSLASAEKAARAALAMMPTEPVSFPVSQRVLVDVPPSAPGPASRPPLLMPVPSVNLAASTMGAAPVAQGELPAQRRPRQYQGPTLHVRRKRGTWAAYLLVPAALVAIAAAAFAARAPIRSALFARSPSPLAAAAAPAPSPATPAPTVSTATAPATEAAAGTSTAAASTAGASTAAASSDPGKPRPPAPKRPSPPSRPGSKPSLAAPKSTPPLRL